MWRKESITYSSCTAKCTIQETETEAPSPCSDKILRLELAHPLCIDLDAGTSAGVGFAIPIDIARSVVPQLIQYGKVVRPALNIQVNHFLILPRAAAYKYSVFNKDTNASNRH